MNRLIRLLTLIAFCSAPLGAAAAATPDQSARAESTLQCVTCGCASAAETAYWEAKRAREEQYARAATPIVLALAGICVVVVAVDVLAYGYRRCPGATMTCHET